MWIGSIETQDSGMGRKLAIRFSDIEAEEYDPLALLHKITEELNSDRNINGLLLCGVDPFIEAQALVSIIARLKSQGYNLSLWIYTNYIMSYFLKHANEWQQVLAESADIVLDGNGEIFYPWSEGLFFQPMDAIDGTGGDHY